MKVIVPSILMYLLSFIIQAQNPAKDSIPGKNKKMWIAPVSLGLTGILLMRENRTFDRFDVRNWRNDKHPDFSTHADDFVMYATFLPVLQTFFKLSRKRGCKFLGSVLLTHGPITLAKEIAQVVRPDSSNMQSFPSGHTAQLFMFATFIHKEYGKRCIWYSIGGYTAATMVGTFRILNNEHWVSDVLVGAGWGIAASHLAYWIDDRVREKRSRNRKGMQAMLLPTYSNGPGVYLSLKFGNR